MNGMVRTLLAVMLTAVATMGTEVHAVDAVVEGAGTHSEGMAKVVELPDGTTRTLGMLTTSFSVTNDFATCMVGEAGGEFAPFNMIMYTTQITSRVYGTTPTGGLTFTIKGLVRSITMTGNVVLEDVVTPFTVTAFDGDPTGVTPTSGDGFHMSIDTTMWPHTTFGKDVVTGATIPIFAGDIAIGHPIAGA